ncbi:hypothetical protein DB42_EA00830 [Neochlamydia sp. EPS4]|nr:hypothetical protein DB42_EA00830 [Neochlamydia sp. EPS4]
MADCPASFQGCLSLVIPPLSAGEAKELRQELKKFLPAWNLIA